MRVTSERATICGGIAIVVGLSLPLAISAGVRSGQQIPQAPAPPATAPPTGAPSTPIASPPATVPAAPKPPAAPAAPYEIAWTLPITAEGPITVALTASSLVIGGPSTPVQAHALTDGALKWKAESGADAAILAADDLVFAVTEGRLTAIDESTGQTRWTVALAGETHGPATRPGVVLISGGTHLYAYRTADGSGLWGQDTKSTALTRVVTSDRVAVLALADRTLASFDLATGRQLWREPIEVTPTTLVAAGERIYMGTAEHALCSHRETDGRLAWCFPIRVPLVGQPVVDNRHVYAAFQDNIVRIFDRQNGAMIRSVPVNALPVAGPSLGGAYLAVPVHTAEFMLIPLSSGADRSAATRLPTPSAQTSPFALAAGASPDGGVLAILTSSPAERLIVCYRKPVAASKPQSSGP